jgi:hypothetical protein
MSEPKKVEINLPEVSAAQALANLEQVAAQVTASFEQHVILMASIHALKAILPQCVELEDGPAPDNPKELESCDT